MECAVDPGVTHPANEPIAPEEDSSGQPKTPADSQTPISNPKPPADAEAVLDALELLAKAAQIQIDRRQTRALVLQACKTQSSGPESRAGGLHALQVAGQAIGLKVQFFQCSPNELSSGFAKRQLPAVTLRENEGDFVAVLAQRGFQMKVWAPQKTPPGGRWMGTSELARILGDIPESAWQTWAFADPILPMEAMSTHSDEHQDHASHKTPFQRLMGLLRLESDDVGVALVYAIGVGIISLAAPLGVQVLVNTVAFGGLIQPIVILTLLVLVAVAFGGLFRALQAWVVERIQQRIFARVAVDLTHRLPRVRIDAFDEAYGPELMNRFFDVLTVQKGAATLLIDGIGVMLSVTVGTLILAFYHPLLLILDIVLVAVVLCTVFLSSKSAVATSIKESKAKYAVAAWIEEMARHPLSFKSAGGAAFAELKGKDLILSYIENRRKHFSVLFTQIGVFLTLQALATAALLGVGGWLVLSGRITLGQLVAAELILTAVVAGFAKLGKYLESLYDLLAAVDKLGHLTDLPLEPSRGTPLRRLSRGAHVHIKNVQFRFGQRAVLQNINLTIPPGGRVAVIGPNGTGKSTLADLLYALRTPHEGHLEIDGKDLREVDLASLREHVALVRGVEIFEGTVADNVRMGREDVLSEHVREALSRTGLWETVSALPNGVNTPLTSGGTRLSAGEARRLVLARAIAGKPRLLVLDESLDDLDPKTRDGVRETLLGADAPWTVLVTTHDRDALRGCDQVYVLEDGSLRPLRGEDHVI